MRVVIFGGRDYANYRKFNEVMAKLDQTWGITTVIEGEQSGADTMARMWALAHNKKLDPYKPKRYDSVGMMTRNQMMITRGRPERGVAFPGGTGTADMIRRCRAHGIPLEIVE